jgi:superfamily II DNA or RNA helicase
MPKPVDISTEDIAVSERRCAGILASWTDKFEFRHEYLNADGESVPGLRLPQIGALHAALAHWSVTHKPSTIVMPTGTGKTETMLALLTCAKLVRLMVVVPSNALRDQISEKFLTLGVLEQCRCLLQGAQLPVVASLLHRPQTVREVDDVFRRANVIVTTMQIAGQCAPEVQRRMAELCSHLFIDEAHHIAARTWNAFKQQFGDKTVVQFTATPFRTDGKRVDGKFIYTYPLLKAQEEGYFQRINFVPVAEYDPDQSDRKIARRAVERLSADLAAGYDHVLMARVDTIDRADILVELYTQEARRLNPVTIHSRTPVAERKALLQQLHSRASRIVVCVDMFGEGFDFPELKVAALHDRHKSLAITLQFIGRFTRSKTTIGEASVVANIADESISNALRNLYAEDADWNFLLRMLSEGATERARKRHELIAGFTSALPEIPLQTLFPRMSAVVYKTHCEEWQPTKIEDVIGGAQLYAGPVINPEHRLAIFVTRDEEPVRWSSVKQVQNVEWNLYVLHWNEELKLLFINSSNKDFHEKFAEAVAGATERVAGESIFRALGKIRRLTLTNLGLSHAFGKNIRYTKFMGADIAEGLTEAERLSRRKSDLFGMGYEEDEKVTVGCSFKGRLWSHRVAYDLSEWVDWCSHIGHKLLDETIDTNDVFAHVIKAKRIVERPPLVPVLASWPEGFQDQPEEMINIEVAGVAMPFFECDTEILNYADTGPLTFAVVSGSARVNFEVIITEAGAEFRQTSRPVAYATVRNRRMTLADWFNYDPPIIHFANGDFLVFNELFELPRGDRRLAYDPNKITVWDWSGVDIRKESQGEEKDPTSIQRRVIERAMHGDFEQFDVIFDDDGSGEIADVVAIRQNERKIIVHLFHCKYSSGEQAGARITDFYAVCAQAQKCVRWREDPRKLFKHIIHRESLRQKAGRASRFEKGTKQITQQILNSAKDVSFEYHVHIVQPALSKAQLTPAHTDLLGATETFLIETYSMPLRVIASA